MSFCHMPPPPNWPVTIAEHGNPCFGPSAVARRLMGLGVSLTNNEQLPPGSLWLLWHRLVSMLHSELGQAMPGLKSVNFDRESSR